MTLCSEIKLLSKAGDTLRGRIKDYINTNGISESEMARRLGIKQPNLNRFLKSKSGLTSTSIEKIAKYFCE